MLKLILDQVRAATAHGIRIPAELRDKAIIDPLVSCFKRLQPHLLTVLQEKAVVEEWFSGCEGSIPPLVPLQFRVANPGLRQDGGGP